MQHGIIQVVLYAHLGTLEVVMHQGAELVDLVLRTTGATVQTRDSVTDTGHLVASDSVTVQSHKFPGDTG
jgi:hypothetical protein